MTQQLQVYGAEFMQKSAYRQDLITRDSPEEIMVGLYDESTDDIGADKTKDYDGTDGDINTEPSDGNYTKETLALDSADVDVVNKGGDMVFDISEHIFDVINTTGTVNHYFVLGRFQSDEAGDTEETWHLLAVGPLEKEYQLSNLDELTNDEAGIRLQ